MTREEAIEFGNMWLEVNNDSQNSHTYKFFAKAVQALEQETVSKESYDHEYFLRKELETKIAKIRAEIDRQKKWLLQAGYAEYNADKTSDAISRQAVLDQTYLWSKDEFLRVTNPFDYLRKRINSLPPAAPQQKTGHWINAYPDIEPNPMFMYGICSVCNFEQPISIKLNFCPNCGAKMKSQESEVNNG